MDKLITQVCNSKKITRHKLVNILSRKFKCSEGPFNEIIFGNKIWIPLRFINELLLLLNASEKEKDKIKNEINKRIELLKVNAPKSKPVKNIRSLNEALCKIAGAIVADGNFTHRVCVDARSLDELIDVINKLKCILPNQKFSIKRTSTNKFRVVFTIAPETKDVFKILKNSESIIVWNKPQINITDQDLNALRLLKNNLTKCFGIDVKIRRVNGKNAWKISFENKVIMRFFTKFLKIPIGDKTNCACEPEIIRKSDIKFRMAFVKGVMTFDGSVNKVDATELLVKSKTLRDNVEEIVLQMGFKVSKTGTPDKKGR